jgi:Immunoglobulin domain
LNLIVFVFVLSALFLTSSNFFYKILIILTFPADSGFPTAPQVLISPAIVNQDENTATELRCTASGSPEPRIQWLRLDGEMSQDVIIRDGYLRFNSLRKSDEGNYRCYAQNSVGDSDQTIQIYVRESRRPGPPRPEQPRPRPDQPQPQEDVSVSPQQHSGEPGEEIVLRCTAYPRGRVTWTKSGAVELPRNVFSSGEELTIRYSTVDDSGRYICNVQFPSGNTRSSFSDVVIVARSNEQIPKIVTLERKYTVVQGGDFELTCESSGSPYPTIEWSMVSFQMKLLKF